MAYQLPTLPYDADMLEPDMSVETVIVHYSKHHQGYVDKLNAVIAGTDQEDQSLESIIEHAQETQDTYLFNNTAQIWNHNYFWNSISPDRTEPSKTLQKALDAAFGSLDGFHKEFKNAATSLFGSGWTWLIQSKSGLKILNTANADLPLSHGLKPLVCCDVWEHAYYLDHKNKRDEYVDTFLKHLINWEFVSENLSAVKDC